MELAVYESIVHSLCNVSSLVIASIVASKVYFFFTSASLISREYFTRCISDVLGHVLGHLGNVVAKVDKRVA